MLAQLHHCTPEGHLGGKARHATNDDDNARNPRCSKHISAKMHAQNTICPTHSVIPASRNWAEVYAHSLEPPQNLGATVVVVTCSVVSVCPGGDFCSGWTLSEKKFEHNEELAGPDVHVAVSEPQLKSAPVLAGESCSQKCTWPWEDLPSPPSLEKRQGAFPPVSTVLAALVVRARRRRDGKRRLWLQGSLHDGAHTLVPLHTLRASRNGSFSGVARNGDL